MSRKCGRRRCVHGVSAALRHSAELRAERRNVLGVVPFVEVALVLGRDVHRNDQQSGGIGGRCAAAGEQLLALVAHQAFAEAGGALGPGRGILAADGKIGRVLQHADTVEIVGRDRDLGVLGADPAVAVRKTGDPQSFRDVLEIVPVVKLVFGGGGKIHCREQDALCHRSLPWVRGIIAETRRGFQRNDRR
jgi:hypothetical protein